MKRFKKVSVFCAMMMLSSTLITGAGCSQVVDEVDADKSQLYVANYSGGAGTEWLDLAAARFEEKYKNKSFEDGKVGVQVMVDHNKSYEYSLLKTSLKTDNNQVYFTQGVEYDYAAKTGLLYDITDLVTKTVNEDDGKTIESKMYDMHKEVWNIEGKYYAIPHYELYSGVSYDAGVFAEKNLYFADELDTDGLRKFVLDASMKKSCGPDGKYNTYDDGLPSSYQEMYKLMDQMVKNSVIPFVWTGGRSHYTNTLLIALHDNAVGGKALNSLYTFDSKGAELEYITDFVGNSPVTAKTTINKDNAYLFKQASGLYYALELCQKVYTTKEYYPSECKASTFSHLDAQEKFMRSGLDGKNPVGMLIEGNYWYNEASEDGIMDRLKNDYPLTYQSKDVRFMPLPRQYSGTVTEGNGSAPTLATSSAHAFINGNINASKVELAKTFLSFCYSDAELVNYTRNAGGLLRSLNYDISECEDELSEFSKSFLEMKKASIEADNFVVQASKDPIHLNNLPYFSRTITSIYWNGTDYYCYNAFLRGITAKEFFLAMKMTDEQWNTLYNIY